MNLQQWWKAFSSPKSRSARARKQRQSLEHRARPAVEQLEDRITPSVASVGVIGIASETPNGPAGFQITLDAPSANDATIGYIISGSATSGSDFDAGSFYSAGFNFLLIPAGSTGGFLPLSVIDDALVEQPESINLQLNSNSDGSVNSFNTASITIGDNDSATISIAATTQAAEPGTHGLFTITQSAPNGANYVIHYDITGTATNGTDYATLSGFVSMSSGSTTTTIPVTVIDDGSLEPNESVILTLTRVSFDSNGSAQITLGTTTSAMVTITSEDTATVSIAATTQAAEAGTNGLFTVTQSAVSATDTVINYTIAGTATAGADYTALSGSVTILAGDTTATISVPVLNDSLVEPTETVVVTLEGTNNGQITASGNATVTITSEDTATVSIAATTQAAEPGTNGLFTVTQSAVSATDTVINYTIAGTATAGADYTALSGSVTILAGDTTATISVPVLNDSIVEPTETVIVTLNGTDNGQISASGSATVNITSEDTATATIAATTQAAEPATNGLFTVTLSNVSATNTVVNYTIGGTAGAGTDYSTLSGSVTILAGNNTAAISVPVLNDSLVESTETVIVTLTGTDNGLITASGSATVNITSEDTATVSIVATTQAAEPGTNGLFTVTLSNVSATNTIINYTVSGTATAGTDYSTLSGTVTILANSTTATISVPVLNDSLVESTETVIVTLDGTDNGQITASGSETVNITSEDTATVSIVATTQAAEPATNGLFTVTLSNVSATNTIINYTVGGTAGAGTDYSTLSGSVTILAGNNTAAISVPVLNDSLVESTETVIVTLTGTDNGLITASGSATVNITSEDTATVSIAATTQAAEPGTNGLFTITQSAVSATNTVVNYTIAGTATAGADHTTLSGSVTILAGSTTATISVPVLDDFSDEAPETVVVTLTATNNGQITASGNATVNIADNDAGQLVVGPGGSGRPLLVLDPSTRAEMLRVTAFPGFQGEVHVALGDVNKDGIADIVAGAGAGGGPHVKVFNGVNGAELYSFYAYSSNYTGGVNVAAGDVDRDGFADIITGSATSSSHVKVFSGATGAEIRSFYAYGNYNGGVTVAAGDINADGFADIITGTATSSSHVKVFSGLSNAELMSFFAYPGNDGGVNVAAGDINRDGRVDIITGSARSSSHVKVFSGSTQGELASFYAYQSSHDGGVRVGSGDMNGDGGSDIITSAGRVSSHVKAFKGVGLTELMSFFAYDSSFNAGAFVA